MLVGVLKVINAVALYCLKSDCHQNLQIFRKNNNFRGYFFFFSGGGLAPRWALETPLKPMILTIYWKGGGSSPPSVHAS